MRFIQFDEYWQTLKKQEIYNNQPEARMICLDNSFSQAILLCNLLFQDHDTLQPFRKDVGIEALKEFRIILRRSILLTPEQLESFVSSNESERETLEGIVKKQSGTQCRRRRAGQHSLPLKYFAAFRR